MRKKYRIKALWPTPDGRPVEVCALAEITVNLMHIDTPELAIGGGQFYCSLKPEEQASLVDALLASTHEDTLYDEIDLHVKSVGEVKVKAIVTQARKLVFFAAYSDTGELVDVTEQKAAIQKKLAETK